MKALGIVRRIDELGRIVIPKEVRKAQGWEAGTTMEMFMDGNKVVMQPFEDTREKQKMIEMLNDAKRHSDIGSERKIEKVINYLKGVN